MPPKRAPRPRAPRAVRTNTYNNVKTYLDSARAFFTAPNLPPALRQSNYGLRRSLPLRTAVDQYRTAIRGLTASTDASNQYDRIRQVVYTTDNWWRRRNREGEDLERLLDERAFSAIQTSQQLYANTPENENGAYTRRMQFVADIIIDIGGDTDVRSFQTVMFDYTTDIRDLAGSFNDFKFRLMDKLAEYDLTGVVDVTFKMVVENFPPRMLADRGNGTLEEQQMGNAEWFCPDTTADLNCLWNACTMASATDIAKVQRFLTPNGKRTKNWENASDYLKSKYIASLPSKEHRMSGADSIKAVCNGEKRRIIVHNMHFVATDTYTPDVAPKKPDLHLMYTRNHYIAMLPSALRPPGFEDYQTLYGTSGKREGFYKSAIRPTECITDLIKSLVEQDNEDRKPYSKPFEMPTEFVPNTFSVFDFETTLTHVLAKGESSAWYPYACGVKTPIHGYRAFWGLDATQQFLEHLWNIRKDEFRVRRDRYRNKLTHTIYAHNGAGFDVYFVLRELMTQSPDLATWRIHEDQVISDGRYLRITLFDPEDDQIRIQFQDSMAYFPGMSLQKIAQEYKCDTQKGSFPHDEVTVDNWPEYRAQCEIYLKDDCMALHEVLTKHEQAVWKFSHSREIIYLCPCEKHPVECNTCKHDKTVRFVAHAKGGVILSQVITAASVAKRTLFKKYYDKRTQPIYTPTEAEYYYMKRGYLGGRNETFVPTGTAINQRVYYKDFTSLYPAMAAQHRLPAGKMRFVQLHGVKATVDNVPNGHVRCMVRTIDFKRLPMHLHKEQGKCYASHYIEAKEMTLYSVEILRGITEKMYEYHMLDAIEFELSVPLLQEVMTDAFNEKQRQTELGNTGLALSAKIVANSTYGVFGTCVYNKEGGKIEHIHDTKLNKAFAESRVIEVDRHGDYFVSKQIHDIPTKDVNIGVASAITSLARIRIWELMDDIRKQGGEVYYCDTDSVITSIDTDKNEFLRKKYNASGTGKELGELKCEITEKLHKDKSCLPEDMSEVGCHMDRLYVGALKCYAMTKNHPLMRRPMEISTQKGGNKKTCRASHYFDAETITIDDEEVLGIRVEHDVWERGGVSTMFRDTENVFQIKFAKGRHKNLRFQYTKAKISADGLRLEPFVWTSSLGYH